MKTERNTTTEAPRLNDVMESMPQIFGKTVCCFLKIAHLPGSRLTTTLGRNVIINPTQMATLMNNIRFSFFALLQNQIQSLRKDVTWGMRTTKGWSEVKSRNRNVEMEACRHLNQCKLIFSSLQICSNSKKTHFDVVGSHVKYETKSC